MKKIMILLLMLISITVNAKPLTDSQLLVDKDYYIQWGFGTVEKLKLIVKYNQTYVFRDYFFFIIPNGDYSIDIKNIIAQAN